MSKKEPDIDFSKMSEAEKANILAWAKQIQQIQKNNALTFRQKLKAMQQLNNGAAFKSISNFLLMHSKQYWKHAPWTERMGIIGMAGGLALFGISGAGIAALGGAIGLPLFLLTGAGGLFIGTIIERLDKNK